MRNIRYVRKRNIKPFFAIFLALLLVVSNLGSAVPVIQANAAEAAISLTNGQIEKQSMVNLSPGVQQTKLEVNTQKGPLKIYNMDIDPKNEFVDFEVGLTNGKLAGLQTVRKQAESISKPGYEVIGGINGDFYNTSNGIPLEAVIHDGKLIRSTDIRSVVGVLKNGEVKIGQPNIQIEMEVTPANSESLSQTYIMNGINKERNTNGIFLYTPDYDSSTSTNDSGTEVILEGATDFLKPEGELTATVSKILKEQGNTKLEEGQMVLSGTGDWKASLEKLVPGDKITVRTTVDAPWDQLEEAVGGYQQLVKNGQAVVSPDIEIHPRTAVGIKADGTVFFTVIDGRQPGVSEGVSLTDLGQMMKDMGAVEALNLDGGGSSTFVARQPGDSHLSLVNVPSDGEERNVANSLLVVSTAPKGNLSYLTVLPDKTNILTGSHTTFEVKGQDQYYHPADITEKVSWSIEADLGQFDENGLFQAGSVAGTGSVITSVNGIQGNASVKVVDKLDSLSLNTTQLALGRGETSKIKAIGYVNGQKVMVDENAFTYRVEGEIGTIDGVGNFKATDGTASGVIKVSIGDLVKEVKVDVGKPPVVIEDFEDGMAGWMQSGARYNSINISAASEPVRFGEKSLRLDYDFTGQRGTSGAYAYPELDIDLEGYPDKIGMWFYGANDGHWIRAQMRDGNNAAFQISFTEEKPGVNWNGWKYIEAEIPKGMATPLKLDLAVRVMETDDANKNKATVYVDNILAVYGKTNNEETTPSGSQYVLEGPEHVYADGEFTLNLKGMGLKELSKTKAVLKFDPNILQVIDQEPNVEGTQILVGPNLKTENIEALQVNNEIGEIVLHTAKLEENTGVQATDLLAAIPFKVSQTANEAIHIELQDGEFTYSRGNVEKAFHMLYKADVINIRLKLKEFQVRYHN